MPSHRQTGRSNRRRGTVNPCHRHMTSRQPAHCQLAGRAIPDADRRRRFSAATSFCSDKTAMLNVVIRNPGHIQANHIVTVTGCPAGVEPVIAQTVILAPRCHYCTRSHTLQRCRHPCARSSFCHRTGQSIPLGSWPSRHRRLCDGSRGVRNRKELPRIGASSVTVRGRRARRATPCAASCC